MADLEVWKKYPLEGEEGEDSYRLDHPTFQNVQRTAFAKGVITDFKKVSEDPIEVESMVKVEIEGYGETADYIPLFYQPKKQYWTIFPVLAQDYNETDKCFTLAWMSFRCGDEVVVLMQAETSGSLEPKYVLGFYDNYPRIGENIFKVIGDANAILKRHSISVYGSEQGPDGLDLQLKTLAVKKVIGPTEEMTDEETYRIWDGTRWRNCSFEVIDTGGAFCGFHWMRDNVYFYTYFNQQSWRRKYFANYIFSIGPYIYLLQTKTTTQWTTETSYQDTESFPDELTVGQIILCPNVYAMQAAFYEDCWLPDPPPSEPHTMGPPSSWTNQFMAYAVHTEETLEAALSFSGDLDSESPGDGFVSTYTGGITIPSDIEQPSLDIYVRPHTKDELIEAGLLNADGTLPGEEG